MFVLGMSMGLVFIPPLPFAVMCTLYWLRGIRSFWSTQSVFLNFLALVACIVSIISVIEFSLPTLYFIGSVFHLILTYPR